MNRYVYTCIIYICNYYMLFFTYIHTYIHTYIYSKYNHECYVHTWYYILVDCNISLGNCESEFPFCYKPLTILTYIPDGSLKYPWDPHQPYGSWQFPVWGEKILATVLQWGNPSWHETEMMQTVHSYACFVRSPDSRHPIIIQRHYCD